MEDLQLIIFDMDGLIFDTERPSYNAMKIAIERQGFEFPLETYKNMIGISDQASDEVLKEAYGKDFSINLILNEYEQKFEEILKNEGIGIKRGVEKLLDYIDNNSMKKCIASSSSRETINNYLSISGLTHRFDFYVSGEEVEKGKPEPDIFLEACHRANESPASVLVLEDSIHGLTAAVKAGIKFIVVPDLIDANEEMDKSAYRVVPDLEKVIEVIEKL